MSRSLRALFSALLSIVMVGASFSPAFAASISPVSQSATQPSSANLPLSFELNSGQVAPEVKYLLHGSGYNLYLTPTEAVMQLKSSNSVVRMQFEGGKTKSIDGVGELSGKVNYLVGNDQSKWQQNVPTYQKVKYSSVYPGIDLEYYGNKGALEYDFIVKPFANPRVIKLKFGGADKLEIAANGDLLLQVGVETVVMHKPNLYQVIAGQKKLVFGSYVLNTDGSVGFGILNYDPSQELVIDPTLAYSSYLGGTGFDLANDIAVDANGNAYIVGYTRSLDFPTANPYQMSHAGGDEDVFISKISADGSSLVYSTYLGGAYSDRGWGVAVNSSGNAYLVGITGSPTFPRANALQPTFGGLPGNGSDGFITELSTDGSSLVFSTFFGGPNTSFEFTQAVAVDSSGYVYVTGRTSNTNFPRVNALQTSLHGSFDAFVAKLVPAGTSLVYSTYLGGGGTDAAENIATDDNGNVYVVGDTSSIDFPVANAYQSTLAGSTNAFLTKINSSGSALVYSTYLGGSSSDIGAGVAVDANGNVYIAGRNGSANFPGCSSPGVFVTKFNSTASSLDYSTCHVAVDVLDVAIDTAGNAYAAGINVNNDALILKLAPSGTVLNAFGYGGSNREVAHGVAIDSFGSIYFAGETNSTDLPTQNPFQPTYGGSNSDAFVMKITENQPPSIDPGGPYQVDEGGSVQLHPIGTDPENGPLTYDWDLDYNGTFETPGQDIILNAANLDGPSVRTVQVRVTDNGGLFDVDQANITVNNVSPTGTLTNNSGTINEGGSATLVFSNQYDPSIADNNYGLYYSFDCTNDGVFEVDDSAFPSTSCAYPLPGVYTAKGRIKDKDGGYNDYTVDVTVNDIPTVDDFVLLGYEGLWVKQNSQIHSGDVGSNISSAGPFLSGGVETNIGTSVDILNSNSKVFGDDVKLQQGSNVYDVYYNTLSGNGTILGNSFTPLAFPVVPAFPTVPSFSAGTTGVTVPASTSQSLAAGDYKDLTVMADATLTLTGGVYNFHSWDIRHNATIYVDAATEIRIADKIDSDYQVQVIPSVGSGISAKDIKIFVTGINGNNGNLGATPKAAKFGDNTTLEANVYVPNGTIIMQQGSDATGAFLGKWVIAGENTDLTVDNGF